MRDTSTGFDAAVRPVIIKKIALVLRDLRNKSEEFSFIRIKNIPLFWDLATRGRRRILYFNENWLLNIDGILYFDYCKFSWPTTSLF